MFDQTTQNGMGMGTYQYNGFAPQQQPKIMNYLNPEEIKELQQQKSQFVLGLTAREALQAKCNHRSADGTSDSLTFDPETGVARCTICGYEFRPIEADTSIEDIKDATSKITDILQTIKIMYTDIPPQAASEYFQIIPLIEKIPQLFEFAAKSFAKYDFNSQWSYNNHNMGGIQMLQNLNAIFGGGVPQQPMGGYQQPSMGFAPQQPGMAAGYPGAAYGQPQQPGFNPFGYPGAAQPQQPGYQPQSQGFQFTPNPQSTPVAPTVPAPAAPVAEASEKPADTTVKQSVTV